MRCYSGLFAAEPTAMKPDYAKWLLEDPRVNFAISARGAAAGIEPAASSREARAAGVLLVIPGLELLESVRTFHRSHRVRLEMISR